MTSNRLTYLAAEYVVAQMFAVMITSGHYDVCQIPQSSM